MYRATPIECKICNKHILSSVWKVHVNGKKHLHYTPKKITVTGTFHVEDADIVHQYFGQFGTIGTKKVTAQNGKVSIDYSFHDTRVHSKIIYKHHYMFGQRLKVTWDEVTTPLVGPSDTDTGGTSVKQRLGGRHRPKKGVHKKNYLPSQQQDTEENTKETILDSIKEVESLTDQIHLLHSKLQVDKAESGKNKKLISEDLHAALAPMFALNRIYFFGSSVTGLDMQGSDLDIYVAHVREDANIKPEVSTLKLMRHLIFKSRKFCDVLLIPNAKIPIIKCIHTQTATCCDLNIRNKMSVCNSQLIRYYLSLDEKMRPLMMFVKFWAECYDLKKVNFFSSYALYMMVIFYLQHEPYNLPSVRELQKDIAPDLVEGWNCAFELKGFSSPALRDESITNLVSGFFKFYGEFDYLSQIIAPYYGAPIEKTRFVQPVELPDGYNLYLGHEQSLIVTSGICIQDPFEHARNVAASATPNCTGKFMAVCRTSLKLLRNTGNGQLYNVLTQDPTYDYVFELEKPEDENEEEWIQAVKDMSRKVLKEILYINVEQVKDTNDYTCSSGQNVWEERISVMKKLSCLSLPPDISDIDREIATTKYIVRHLQQTLHFTFTMTMDFKSEPPRAEFILRPSTKKCKVFLHVAHFFAVTLQKYLLSEESCTDFASFDFDTAIADVFSSERSHTRTMTQQDDKIRENAAKDRVRETSAGKHVKGPSLADETQDDRTNGGQTSKSDEEDVAGNEDEEEDEDVPADFFDDFSNQDFMDGLDIVDAWDEEKLLEGEERSSTTSTERKKRAHSPIRFASNSPIKRRKSMRSRSKSPTRRVRRSNSPSQKRVRSRSKTGERSERRDPEKTKRDIDRDKVKCAKDREQKLVDDKLRLVETGLVPPGMEMESDVSAILREKDKEKRRSGTRGSNDKIRNREPPKTEPDRDRERRPLRRSRSRELRRPVRHSPSPVLYRPRPREPIRHRKRTPSIDSNLSDRELWMRSNRKWTRSRSRSRENAIRRAKAKKYEEERKKKKTFLEEIRDKLNETRPPVAPAPYNVPQYAAPTPHAIPAPVPAPQFFQPTPNPPMQQQYDQSFFVGEPFPNMIQHQPHPNFGMVPNQGNVLHPGMPMAVPARPMVPKSTTGPAVAPPAPVLKPQAMISPKIQVLSDVKMQPKVEEPKKDSIEDVGKLFADKKISLSDFLSITAKCEVQSSSPEHLQKKIKVISRCQDAIKTMSEDTKFNGRLCVRPSIEQKSKSEMQYQSPLRRIPLVRFQFTTPAKVSEDSDSFSTALDKILQKIGILQEPIDLDEKSQSSSKSLKVTSSFADQEAASLTIKAAFLNAKKAETKSECEECKKRKAKTFAEVGSQCANDKETTTVGTQVTEEDLSPTKGLPKNDSIAYLTPAQLLGKEKDMEKEKVKEEESPVKKSPLEVTVASPRGTPPIRRGKPKPPLFSGRGTRKAARGRPAYNNDYADYAYEESGDYRDFDFEEPREDFQYERRFGGPSGAPRYARQYVEEDIPQPLSDSFRDDEANFMDFRPRPRPRPYRGRGGPYASRY